MSKLPNCLCGSKPRFKRRSVDGSKKVLYYYLDCSNLDCTYGMMTFATREKEFCSELWIATVNKKIELGEQPSNKNKDKHDE